MVQKLNKLEDTVYYYNRLSPDQISFNVAGNDVKIGEIFTKDGEEVNEEGTNAMTYLTLFRQGRFKHPLYGDINFTRKKLDRMIMNFRRRAFPQEVSGNIDHKTEFGSLGFVSRDEDGLMVVSMSFATPTGNKVRDFLVAKIELTPMGLKAIQERKYRYISAEVNPNYTTREVFSTDEISSVDQQNNPVDLVEIESGKMIAYYGETLTGFAFTNNPFIPSLASNFTDESHPEGSTTGLALTDTDEDLGTLYTFVSADENQDDLSEMIEWYEANSERMFAAFESGDYEFKPAKYANINFKPSAGVAAASASGVRMVEEGKGGSGLESATVREARAMARRENITVAKARKGFRFWARNIRFLKADKDSPAWVSALLWGGRPGPGFFRRIVEAMAAADKRNMTDSFNDSIKVGDFVSWNSSGGRARGRVIRIVRDGSLNVPGADVVIEGTPDNPAVLIRLYRPDADGNPRPTDTRVGHKMSTLSKIAAMTAGAKKKMGKKLANKEDKEMGPGKKLAKKLVGKKLVGKKLVKKLTANPDDDQPSKLRQMRAGYTNMSKGSEKCSNCGWFNAPNGCGIVEGSVQGEGWCELWGTKSLAENEMTNPQRSDYTSKEKQMNFTEFLDGYNQLSDERDKLDFISDLKTELEPSVLAFAIQLEEQIKQNIELRNIADVAVAKQQKAESKVIGLNDRINELSLEVKKAGEVSYQQRVELFCNEQSEAGHYPAVVSEMKEVLSSIKPSDRDLKFTSIDSDEEVDIFGVLNRVLSKLPQDARLDTSENFTATVADEVEVSPEDKATEEETEETSAQDFSDNGLTDKQKLLQARYGFTDTEAKGFSDSDIEDDGRIKQD